MFRCKECGTEYNEKPDYCDCGNDTFEEIVQTPKQPEIKREIPPAPKTVAAPRYNNTVQIQTPKQEYNRSFNTVTDVPKVTNTGDMLSLGLFAISIILAVCTLFVFGNPKEQAVQQPSQDKPAQTTPLNIPSVDAFWDNSTAGMVEKTTAEIGISEEQPQVPQTAQPVQKETATPLSKFDEWLNRPKRVAEETPRYTTQTTPTQTQPKQQTQTQVKPKTTTQTQTKPAATNNAKINSPGAPNDLLTRVQNNIKYTNTTTQAPAQNTTKSGRKTDPMTNFFPNTTTSKPATTQKTTATPTVTTPKSTTTTAQKTPPTLRNATTQPVKSSAQLQQEVSSYKYALRNNIGRKINFANVVGDGNCSITFRVDSSGQLINRNFATKSSNITLNDAVYNAMMSTPRYNPPPEGYKSETMTLSVKIYNGNYEISLH